MSTVDVISHNAEAWDLHVKNAWQWTVPVSHEEIEAAPGRAFFHPAYRQKPVPREWFPEKLAGLKILALPAAAASRLRFWRQPGRMSLCLTTPWPS